MKALGTIAMLALVSSLLAGCVTRTVYVEVPVVPEPYDRHELIEAVEALINECRLEEL